MTRSNKFLSTIFYNLGDSYGYPFINVYIGNPTEGAIDGTAVSTDGGRKVLEKEIVKDVPQRVTDNNNDKLKNFRLRELKNLAKARN